MARSTWGGWAIQQDPCMELASDLVMSYTGERDGDAFMYRDFIEKSVVGIYRTTVSGKYILVNDALVKLYGFNSQDHLIDTYNDIGSQLYVDPTRRADFANSVAKGDEISNFDAEIYRHDGRRIWIREHARCVRDQSGEILYYEGTVTDITAQKSAEETVRLLITAFNTISEGIAIMDGEYKVYWLNRAFTDVTGYEFSDLAGDVDGAQNFFQNGDVSFRDVLGRARKNGSWRGEWDLYKKSGEMFSASISVALTPDEAKGYSYFVIVCSDITQRKRTEEDLKFHANFDALTNIPNRVLVRHRLKEGIACVGSGTAGLAVFYIDLDRFKPVNDRFGHAAGDVLLKMSANRLRNSLRASDTVGRLGGDEFLVIAADINDLRAAAYVAEKIRYAFNHPFEIEGHEVFCTASIGIACYPRHGTDVDSLITNADTAMYHAKDLGTNQYCFFEEEMSQANLSGIGLEGELRRAVRDNAFELHYQPKLDLRTGDVTEVEALIRWRHPILGWVPPDQFIPLCERIGLIRQIGHWTLRTACLHLKDWIAHGSSIRGVAVNLSQAQFSDGKFLALVGQVLRETGLDAGMLELELTESTIVEDIDRAIEIMRRLKALGVRLAVDDFGTGYSSLASLKRFPIDTLKIDKSFIDDVENGRTDQAIVTTMLGLGKNLGLSVIAEGVETPGQLAFLRKIACDGAQGFLIARPMPAASVRSFTLSGETAGGALPMPAGQSV